MKNWFLFVVFIVLIRLMFIATFWKCILYIIFFAVVILFLYAMIRPFIVMRGK
jgi:hypothetical protein